jgi:hypothetical protein
MSSFSHMKAFIKSIPVLGPALVRIRGGRVEFKDSSDYWERRYRTGGNSGAGSYNQLARFKAGFLNKFVADNKIASVIEFGCGDGAQLKLATYPKYTGVDVSPKAVEMCSAQFSGDASKRFLHSDSVTPDAIADLSMSLDVIYHLLEDPVYDLYMKRLFEFARRYVIVYSSNMDQDWPARHVRHRKFTTWIEQNRPDWSLQDTIKNAYPYDPKFPEQTSFADFYIFARL